MATNKIERDEAIARLREWVKPGDTVYTILRHVSSSGMTRYIDIIHISINAEGKPSVTWLGWNAAKALDMSYGRDYEGVKVSGCGMDMGFSLVCDLSSVLFGDGYFLNHRWL